MAQQYLVTVWSSNWNTENSNVAVHRCVFSRLWQMNYTRERACNKCVKDMTFNWLTRRVIISRHYRKISCRVDRYYITNYRPCCKWRKWRHNLLLWIIRNTFQTLLMFTCLIYEYINIIINSCYRHEIVVLQVYVNECFLLADELTYNTRCFGFNCNYHHQVAVWNHPVPTGYVTWVCVCLLFRVGGALLLT